MLRPNRLAGTTGKNRCEKSRQLTREIASRYFQPACRSHSRRARGLAFSHCVIERVSLSSIFSFMQIQYARTIAGVPPGSSRLSRMHSLTHLRSSAFICWANVALDDIRAVNRPQKVLSRFVLELGDAISGISRVPSQAARSIG